MKQTHPFKAEMSRLMDLVINSLYQNRDVFLRELISNASDACERLRFLSISNPDLLKGQDEIGVRVSIDQEQKTVTIADSGIGMSQQEVIDNLGQIASSGTRRFLEEMQSQDESKEDGGDLDQFIGKFGVGFYAAFLVADRVDVYTRKAGDSADQGVHFSTDGRTDYTVEEAIRPGNGTEIILHLNEKNTNILESEHLVELAKKYSSHISFPLRLPATEGAVVADVEATDSAKDKSQEYQVINPSPALWLRPSKDISSNEYKEFYRGVSQNFDDPLSWVHCQLEGAAEYKALLYIPTFVPPQMFQQDFHGRVKLYIRRVFVTLEHKLLPEWLRFMVGVVEAPNLALNISREALQNEKNITLIRKSLVKKIVDHFSKLAKDDDKTWAEIYDKYAVPIKQGVILEQDHRESLSKLLRFATTRGDESTTLDEYLSRAPSDQKDIHYLTAPDLKSAKDSPYLEALNQRNIEVLLCTDPVDEWMIHQLEQYRDRPFKAVHKGEFSLDQESTDKTEKSPSTKEDLIRRIRLVLEKQVNSVRTTERLHQSPACLVSGSDDLSLHTKDALRQHGHMVNPGMPDMEINPAHPLIQGLEKIENEENFQRFVQVLYDVCTLSAVGRLENPAESARRIVGLLSEQTTPSEASASTETPEASTSPEAPASTETPEASTSAEAPTSPEAPETTSTSGS